MSKAAQFTWAQYLRACKQTGQKPERKHKTPLQQLVTPLSELEALFDRELLRLAPQLPKPLVDHAPWEDRGHTCDRVWLQPRVVVEVEGYGHRQSRYEGDVYKYNRLAAEGWCLLRCSRKTLEVEADAFFALLVEVIERRSN